MGFLEEQGALHKMGSSIGQVWTTLPEDEVRTEIDRLAASYIDNILSARWRKKFNWSANTVERACCVRSVTFHGGPHAIAFHRKAVVQLGFYDSRAYMWPCSHAQDQDWPVQPTN